MGHARAGVSGIIAGPRLEGGTTKGCGTRSAAKRSGEPLSGLASAPLTRSPSPSLARRAGTAQREICTHPPRPHEISEKSLPFLWPAPLIYGLTHRRIGLLRWDYPPTSPLNIPSLPIATHRNPAGFRRRAGCPPHGGLRPHPQFARIALHYNVPTAYAITHPFPYPRV